MRTLGIIGGMGPLAGAYFLEMLTNLTDAERDQEHIPAILISDPTVPDRTGYILKKIGEDPSPILLDKAKKLEQMGASAFCATCITSHYFFRKLKDELPIPFIDMVELAANYLCEEGIKKVGIMATTGTVQVGLFQEVCREKGIECISPSDDQQEVVMNVIYNDIKAGKMTGQEDLNRVADTLKDRGAGKVLLGCTELSLLSHKLDSDVFADPMKILAKKVIALFGKKAKE